jgi:murein DD-endopeptidase MepM/ murein hydrolase activator NlpD
VLAPADAVVTFVLDGRPDQMIGSTDRRYQSGNNVVIGIGGGRYLLMGHLSPGSIQVKVGDQVTLGQQIAKVGNSGNTTEPHLHIQAQTIGTGVEMSRLWMFLKLSARCTPTRWCSAMSCSPDEGMNPDH